MVNVFARFLLGQWINMVANRYSLSDGFIAFFVDHSVEFALADEKNVDQFAVVQLDVRQKSDLFDKLVIEPLGFVNNQQNFFILC